MTSFDTGYGKAVGVHRSVWQGCKIMTVVMIVPNHTWRHVLTHRMFARNAQSSRATPTATLLKQANYTPDEWLQKQKGMVPASYPVQDPGEAARLWEVAREAAKSTAESLSDLGVAKEITNRLLEPFSYTRGIVTGTAFAWENFFALRCKEDTQSDTRLLARECRTLWNQDSRFEERMYHLPFVELEDHEKALLSGGVPEMECTSLNSEYVSAARCARVSYRSLKGRDSTLDEDLDLAERLRKDGHWSPFEHVCRVYTVRLLGPSCIEPPWTSLRQVLDPDTRKWSGYQPFRYYGEHRA